MRGDQHVVAADDFAEALQACADPAVNNLGGRFEGKNRESPQAGFELGDQAGRTLLFRAVAKFAGNATLVEPTSRMRSANRPCGCRRGPRRCSYRGGEASQGDRIRPRIGDVRELLAKRRQAGQDRKQGHRRGRPNDEAVAFPPHDDIFSGKLVPPGDPDHLVPAVPKKVDAAFEHFGGSRWPIPEHMPILSKVVTVFRQGAAGPNVTVRFCGAFLTCRC